LRKIEGEQLLSVEALEKLRWRNATRLLKLQGTTT